jgi:hypothetical protein
MAGELHNIQQLSDAVQELQRAGSKDSENAAAFLVSEIQPLKTAIASVQADVASLQAQFKALKG